MDDLRCGNCIFLDAKNPSDIICRRHPPVIVIMREKGADRVKQFIPNVHPFIDWCGEHKKSS
jgi:hypothetical protein